MDGIVGSLKLGWDALLLKQEAYEEMRAAASPVVKGLILIIVVGVVIALCGFVGDVLEWASTPNLDELRDTVFYYMTRMPFWEDVLRDAPNALEIFEQNWNFGWNMAEMFSPNAANAAVNVILLPLGLIVRWLIYGLLAYLFARWLGGTGDLSETLGVLALAVAPQALNVLRVFPFVEVGSLVSLWAILCAYVGLKTAHKLPWSRAAWATLLPFILVLVIMLLAACLGTSIFAAAVKGG
jgi:hypothetical protein